MKKKLLFIHELSSSSNSMVVKCLRDCLKYDLEVIAEDIPLPYDEAMDKINSLNEIHRPDIVLGISMGGMFAHQIDAPIRVLVNPAFHVSEVMTKNIGIWRWSWKRDDGQTHFEITDELISQYQLGEAHQFDSSIFFSRNRTVAMFADRDELVNCLYEYLLYYNEYVRFSGTHFMNEKIIQNDVVPLVRRLLQGS